MAPDNFSDKRLFSRVVERVSWWSCVVSGVSVFLLMLLVTHDVTVRGLGGMPFLWGFDISELLVVTCTYMAMAYAMFEGRHVRMEAVVNLLGVKVHTILWIAAYILMMVVLVFWCWLTWGEAWEALTTNMKTPAGYPLGLWLLVLPFGGLVFFLQTLVLMFRAVGSLRK